MEYCPMYCGGSCVDSSCPAANEDFYRLLGSDDFSCEKCWYYKGCEDCWYYDTDYCLTERKKIDRMEEKAKEESSLNET